MIDFEWLVEDETRSIPTLASNFSITNNGKAFTGIGFKNQRL